MKKILTIVLDGFGMRDEEKGNAIKAANKNNFDYLWNNYPHCLLYASEEYVGLPKGQFGNSEIGHMTIGAGRILKEGVLKVDEFFDKNALDNNEKFMTLVDYINNNEKTVHVMGLMSNGKVHSSIEHTLKLLRKLSKYKVENVYIHVITDGRDVPVDSSNIYIETLKKEIEKDGVGKIATICGRYYAMDRDNKWERTKIYYDLVTRNIGVKTNDIEKTINACYKKNITDEFLPPIICDSNGTIKNGDVLIWMNFRSDRAKQILTSLTNEKFDKFITKKMDKLKVITILPVDKSIKVPSLGDLDKIENPLGVYISKLGLNQARIAETEKYAHVTYFFDGCYNDKIDNCDKYLVASPKVATYDKMPEMSSIEVCKKILQAMEKDYDFIFANFANCDMVGHTGNMEATVKAVEAVDKCLGAIIESAKLNFYTIVLLADHGNADIMIDAKGKMVTTHTLSRVPFIITDKKIKLSDGDLTNVAPTILDYMDIAKPKEMKDSLSLIEEK